MVKNVRKVRGKTNLKDTPTKRALLYTLRRLSENSDKRKCSTQRGKNFNAGYSRGIVEAVSIVEDIINDRGQYASLFGINSMGLVKLMRKRLEFETKRDRKGKNEINEMRRYRLQDMIERNVISVFGDITTIEEVRGRYLEEWKSSYHSDKRITVNQVKEIIDDMRFYQEEKQ